MIGSIIGGAAGGGGGGGGGALGGVTSGVNMIGGASIGGIMGLVGGAIQGVAQAHDARDLRRAIRGGIAGGQAETVRQVTSILGSSEYLAGAGFIRSMFGIGGDPRAEWGRSLRGMYGWDKGTFGTGADFYDQGLAKSNKAYFENTFGPGAVADPKLSALENRLARVQMEGGRASLINKIQGKIAKIERGVARAGGATGGPPPAFSGMDPLTAEFQKQIASAQMARGVYSSHAAASAEASGLAAFKTRLQMEMLPQLFALGEAPISLASKYESGNLSRRVFASSGGKASYNVPNMAAFGGSPLATAVQGGIAGAFGGAAIGASMGGGGGGASIPSFGGGGGGMAASAPPPQYSSGQVGGPGSLFPAWRS